MVETNKVPTAPVRGAGYPEGCFAMDRVLDAIARDRGISSVEVRRRNLVPGSAMPYATPMQARSTSTIVYESGDFPACLDLALQSADHAGFAARRKKAREAGRLLGFGIGAGIKGTGRGPFESAIVRVGRSGRVSIYTGAMAMGQGLKTTLAQIAADQLGVRPEDITVVSGDTSTIQLGLGGFASRQTVTAGNSVHLAAKAVREKAISTAALMLDVPATSLDIRDGIVIATGKNLSLSLRDIADTLAGAPGYKFPARPRAGARCGGEFRDVGADLRPRRARGRARGGPGDRRRHAAQLCGGQRLRTRHQSDDRRRPDPRRRGARHRQCDVRAHGV